MPKQKKFVPINHNQLREIDHDSTYGGEFDENDRFEMINVKVVENFSAENAAVMLAKNTLNAQRNFKDARYRDLSQKIKRKDFRKAEIAIATLTYDNNKEVLVNGQHQLAAIIETNEPQTAVIERWRCNTPKQLARLYVQFDDGNARTNNEVAKAYSPILGGGWEKGQPKAITNISSACCCVEKNWTLKNSTYREERFTILKNEKYSDAALWLKELVFDNRSPKYMTLIPTLVSMIGCYLQDPDDATAFWTSVRDGVNLQQGDSALVLREYLNDPNRKKTNGLQKISQCQDCWKHYRSGTPKLRIKHKKVGKVHFNFPKTRS